MLSAIIATRDSERALVPTLACLVPAVTAGILRDVIVADFGSSDATAEVAEIAGCRWIVAPGRPASGFKTAAQSAKGPWLLFLRAGLVLEASWVAAAVQFMAGTEASAEARADIFRPPIARGIRPTFAEAFALLRLAWARRAGAEQALLIAKSFYRQLGGHPDEKDPETALLRRLGSRSTMVLGCLAASAESAVA